MRKWLLTLVLIAGCKEQQPGFYDHAHTWDLRRIPLVAPYELVSSDESTWMLTFKASPPLDDLGSGEIDSLAVVDSCIILYSPQHYDRHAGNVATWYVIDPRSREESKFFSADSTSAALRALGITMPRLLAPEPIFMEFESRGALPWRTEISTYQR